MRIGSTTWKGYDNLTFMSGQTILECKDFAPFLGGCCKDCHNRASAVHVNLERRLGLYVIRPPAPPGHELEWMADFSLHICAHVCCTIVCRVTQLPNSWWKAKAIELNTEEIWRQHAYGRGGGIESFVRTSRQPKVEVINEDDDEEGFEEWMKG
jgi:hypothetical protein